MLATIIFSIVVWIIFFLGYFFFARFISSQRKAAWVEADYKAKEAEILAYHEKDIRPFGW